MGQLKDFFRKYGWMYLPGLLFLVASSYINTLQPRILGDIIDTLKVVPIDRGLVRNRLFFLILVAVMTLVTRFIWRYIIMGNSRNMESYLRKRLFAHLQSQPPQFFNHQKTGDLMAYAINDINAIRMTFGPSLALGVSGITTSVLSIAGMSGGVHPRLTLFALIPIPVVVVLVVVMGRQVQRRFRRVQETFAAVSDRVQEDISGIRVIKAYVQEEEEAERFETLNRRSRKVNLDMVKVSASMRPIVLLLFGISFTISLIYGGGLVRSGEISVGDFVAFNGYLTLIVMPIQSIARIITIVQRGLASLKRYNGILEIPPAVVDGTGDAPASAMSEGLEISNLTFFYPGTTLPALAGIDLRLEPGRSLGIVGRTGSGKTTLALLLSKMYNAPDGAIRFGGWDINRFRLADLRNAIASVPQDNFLFSATIADNIRFFDDAYTQEQIEEAARLACVDGNIREFPDGYLTQVGERGMSLSGGQKQRIAIARSLIRDTPLLVLDDALSAVDTRTEESILENLHQRKRNRQSSIIISHRISAVMACDEIIVLDTGRIVERGTHAELVAAGGFYAQTAASQADSGEGES
ncbi:MAG: ABC transporter ATP-binding protein [Clostridia bacterium]|nr:ABC transporter ATP-binding protein [Clostridia bacterium]